MRGSIWIEKRELLPSKMHPNGRVRYYVFSEVDGARLSHGGHDLLRDAQATRRILGGKLANDTFGKRERENPLFNDYYNEWWISKKQSLGLSGIRGYESSFRLYILPYFKKRHLADITPRDVQAFIDSLHGSPYYVKVIYAQFRSLINTAMNLDIIERTPCRGIILPKIPNSKKKYLGAQDIWRFIAANEKPFDVIFTVLALSGIRVGECLGLKVKNVDFPAGKIRVEATWDAAHLVLQEPKTKTSVRSVEMMSCLSEVLKAYLEETGLSSDPESFLFPSPYSTNRPWTYSSIRTKLHDVLEKQGLPDCNIHSLRHSFASIMIAAGVSIPTLSRNLGHSSPVITMRVYAHEIEDMVGPALDHADELFRDARETALAAQRPALESQSTT
jgi:integrase